MAYMECLGYEPLVMGQSPLSGEEVFIVSGFREQQIPGTALMARSRMGFLKECMELLIGPKRLKAVV